MIQKRINTSVASTLAIALIAAACADPASPVSVPDDASFARSTVGTEMSDKSGVLYVANLRPLNARAQQVLDPDRERGGPAHGKAYFRVVDGTVTATIEMDGVEPMMVHPQHIHAADRCPTMSADTNGDGFVDVLEGVPFYGPILIPLDGSIENTTTDVATLPNPGAGTSYLYREQGSVAAIEAAIGEPLALTTRHVVIHGVDLSTPLPESVQSLGGLPSQLTLPIACGEIRRIGR